MIMLEEHGADELTSIKTMYSFMGLNSSHLNMNAARAAERTPTKKPVNEETIRMLDDFYEPFNRQLARTGMCVLPSHFQNHCEARLHFQC